MKIGGLKKLSLTNFPGKRAMVVYTQGCDWACPYCRFQSLVRPTRFQPRWTEEEVFQMLDGAEQKLDAIVVTGGEPLVQPGLEWFLRRVKRLGLAVKLETNGGRPQVLAALLRDGLVDYVALDVKGPLGNYAKFVGCALDPGEIELAMELVRGSGVDYEFCTTLVGGLHTAQDVEALAPLVHGAKKYVIQHYVGHEGACGGARFSPPDQGLLRAAREACRMGVGEFIERPDPDV
jgi:pyruvate formate lyase activating enzyme